METVPDCWLDSNGDPLDLRLYLEGGYNWSYVNTKMVFIPKVTKLKTSRINKPSVTKPNSKAPTIKSTLAKPTTKHDPTTKLTRSPSPGSTFMSLSSAFSLVEPNNDLTNLATTAISPDFISAGNTEFYRSQTSLASITKTSLPKPRSNARNNPTSARKRPSRDIVHTGPSSNFSDISMSNMEPRAKRQAALSANSKLVLPK